jgi:hypothetical protein
MVCTPVAIIWLHWVAVISLPVTLALIVFFGLLAYQIEYHPLLAVLWCCGLFIPYASVIFILVLFFQAKSYLTKQNYRIALLGAKPLPHQDVVADMDELIKAGKIRMPGQDTGMS